MVADETHHPGATAGIAIAALLCLAAGCTGREDPPPYNLLVITVDALRADHLGCFGYPRDTSPNLDAFAAESVAFRNFFTVSPKSGPAVTTLFTGKYVQDHGVTENLKKIPGGERLLAERLRRAVRTGAVVSNPILGPGRGYDGGFDDFVQVEDSQGVAERGLTWLERYGDEPFFLWLHFLDPRGPYAPPDELRRRFVGDAHYDETRRIRREYTPTRGLDPSAILGAIPSYQRLGDIDVVDYYIAQYDAEIFWVDRQIGRVLDFLAASGLADSTIVVLTSNQGESLGEHDYFFEHGMLVNDASIHVPLIVSYPGATEPRVVESLAQNTDLLPTLLTLLDREPAERIDGVDLSGLILRGDDAGPVRGYVYSCTAFPSEYVNFFETVRTTDAKLVRMDGERLFFHDLRSDPSETRDLKSTLEPAVLEQWTHMFDGFGKDAVPAEQPSVLPDELRRRLEALGYARP